MTRLQSEFFDSTDAFEAALDYLYSFINFEQRQQDRYMSAKLDESRPKRFFDALGASYTKYPVIHIAGTKGKGSVAAMCAACLRAAGYRVGLFTSPHLQDFRERIRILTPDDPNGLIPEGQFVQIIEQIKKVEPNFPDVTWFEILTAVSFIHFARQAVDVAVIEVGLGGRLDSTNVVTPLVSVITSLSLDHTKFLGDTLTEIAFEKGGIIKEGIPVVSANQDPEAMAELQRISVERESPMTIVGKQWQFAVGEVDNGRSQELIITESPDPDFIPQPSTYTLSLTGVHQLENGAVAIAALQQVRPYFPNITQAVIQKGLAGVQWNGRLQTIHPGNDHTPMLLVDCAHNPDSAEKLAQALQTNYQYNNLWLIIGAPKDKDIPGMMQHLAPLAYGITATTASHPRSATPEEIAGLGVDMGTESIPTRNMDEALRVTWGAASPGDLICVTGSIIVVGDLLNYWELLQSQLLASKMA